MSCCQFLLKRDRFWPHWVTLLIWSLGLCSLTGLAMHAFLPLVDEYRYSNVATQIQIMGKNKTVKPPQITLCIPWTGTKILRIAEHVFETNLNVNTNLNSSNSTACVDCDRMRNHSWDVWTYMNLSEMPTVEDVRQAIVAEMMSKLIRDDGDPNRRDDHEHNDRDEGDRFFEALSVLNYAWNKPLIDAAWDFLDCLQELDSNVGLDPVFHKPALWCFTKYSNLSNQFLIDSRKSNRLFHRIIEVLCEYLEFKDVYHNALGKRVCVDTLYLSPNVLIGQQFCFAWPTMDENLSKALITSNPLSHYGPHAESTGANFSKVSLYTDIDRLVSLITDDSHSPLGAERAQTFPIYVSDGFEDYVRIRYAVTATVVEKRPTHCYKEPSPNVCRNYCIVKRIMAKCECVPFAFNSDMMNASSSYCDTRTYGRCHFNKMREYQRCDGQCTIQCEYTSYQWIVSRLGNNGNRVISSRRYWTHDEEPVGGTDNKYRKKFEIGLDPISTTYMEFDVVTKNTFPQFLSQAGAIFNLYLGFSGLSVIGFLIFCSRLLASWYWTVWRQRNLPKVANAIVLHDDGMGGEKRKYSSGWGEYDDRGGGGGHVSSLERMISEMRRDLDSFKNETLRMIEGRLEKLERNKF